jgi:hypothetical protein
MYNMIEEEGDLGSPERSVLWDSKLPSSFKSAWNLEYKLSKYSIILLTFMPPWFFARGIAMYR